MLYSICEQIWKTQQWPQDWKSSVFIPIPKKDNAKECSHYHTIALISCTSKVKENESEVTQSCPTLCNAWTVCSLPSFSIHGIFQVRVLEWVAISFSRGSSQPRIKPGSPSLQADALPSEPPGKPHASKGMLKILQAELQQYVNCELPVVQAGFKKARGTSDQITNICWIIEKAREFQKNIYFSFIDYAKAFD